MQNKIFEQHQADAYFERNKNNNNTFIAQYLVLHVEHAQLKESSCALFGIGSGLNLAELEKCVNTIHGFDVSEKSVQNIRKLLDSRYDGERVFVRKLNFVEPFKPPIHYDIVLLDFFAYILTNEELELVKANLMRSIKPRGFILIHDFIVRDFQKKPDSHDSRLSVYKRNINFYLKYFTDFDLVSFNLYDSKEYMKIIEKQLFNKVNMKLTPDDNVWVFCAIFQLR